MKVYIVTEAFYRMDCGEWPEAYAEAHRSLDAAYHALRELADERIYEAYEGADDRDELTDDAIVDTFGSRKLRGVTKTKARDGWKWINGDRLYVWRIIESEV